MKFGTSAKNSILQWAAGRAGDPWSTGGRRGCGGWRPLGWC